MSNPGGATTEIVTQFERRAARDQTVEISVDEPEGTLGAGWASGVLCSSIGTRADVIPYFLAASIA